MRSPISLKHLTLAAGFCLLALAGACSTKSPTAPEPTSNPPAGGANAAWTITITSSAGELTQGATEPVQVTVRVRRTDNGQPPPNGTTIAISTSLGNFGDVNGDGAPDQTGFAQLVNGVVTVNFFAGDTTGTAAIVAQLENSTGRLNLRILEAATLFISGVAPSTGSPQGGDTVTISGQGFAAPARVLFGGSPAVVKSVSATAIRVVTPPASDPQTTSPIAVAVSVTVHVNQDDQASDSLPNAFTYAPGGGVFQPVVFSVTPASGPNEGGTRISLIGDGFVAPVQVVFGTGITCAAPAPGVEATVESVSRTEIVVRSPAATGFGQDLRNKSVNLVVKNLTSGLCTTKADAFRYGVQILITGLGPGSGPFTGGTNVTITGQGFDAPVAVALGGTGQIVLSVTGTQIVFKTVGINVSNCPANGEVDAGAVHVVNLATGDGADGPNFTYLVPLPQILGLKPNSGTVGTTTTITGFNFSPAVQVFFGGAESGSAATVTSSNATSITVKVPSPPSSFTFNTEPCDGNGDGIPNGTRDIPTPISVSVKNVNGTGCSATLANAFTVTPPSTTCTGDTSTPPPPPAPQCSDGIDNDGDGLTDYNGGVSPPGDPQCTSDGDNSESS